jgi:hypothetical protein
MVGTPFALSSLWALLKAVFWAVFELAKHAVLSWTEHQIAGWLATLPTLQGLLISCRRCGSLHTGDPLAWCSRSALHTQAVQPTTDFRDFAGAPDGRIGETTVS